MAMGRLSNRLKAPGTGSRLAVDLAPRHAFYDWCNEVLAEADDRQREAVLASLPSSVHAEMDLDAVDLLAAIEAAPEAARRRPAGAAVDDDSTRLRGITAGQPPGAAQPVEQPTPQPAGSSGQTA